MDNNKAFELGFKFGKYRFTNKYKYEGYSQAINEYKNKFQKMKWYKRLWLSLTNKLI